jgi:hypothetical protein
MQDFLLVQDTEDNPTIIPIDNIACIAVYEGITRIYLRHMAMIGSAQQVWYILTREPVMSITKRIIDANSDATT